MLKNSLIYFTFFLCCIQKLYSQDPVSFQISSEEGLPNQTVYSILQDNKGFLWLGTDVGLFRYDGIRYLQYKNPLQKSRSLTGLVKNTAGAIFGFNFSGQIFFVENDSLLQLDSWNKGSISNICLDHENLWVCYDEGVEVYCLKTKQWRHFNCTPNGAKGSFTHSCFIDRDNSFWCVGSQGLVQIKDNREIFYNINWPNDHAAGAYQMAFKSNKKFIVSRVGGDLFYLKDGEMQSFYSKNLNPLLKNKKITRIEEDTKHCIWIYTYSGVIVYDIAKDSSSVFYEDKAFSCGIQDIENTYWLSTLHDGILKVPDLSYKLWEIKEDRTENYKVHKLVRANNSVFFATVDGKIGELNVSKKNIQLIPMQSELDIQSLALTEDKQSVLFSIQNEIYKIQDQKPVIISNYLPPTKDVLQSGTHYIAGTSKGTFLIAEHAKLPLDTLTTEWTRSIATNATDQIWLATNDGVKILRHHKDHAAFINTALEKTQIISLSYSNVSHKLYVLTFNGSVYELTDSTTKANLLFTLEPGTISYQLKAHNAHLYLATNNGLKIFDLKTKQLNSIDRLSGLISNTIHALDIDELFIWLATAKGIQQIPATIKETTVSSGIYLKHILINNRPFISQNELILDHRDELSIELDAVSLSSENKLQYAYRVNKGTWILLPASIKQIGIPFLSSGNFDIEIKLINHLGKNSVNRIHIIGYMSPPFWQRWWFYVLILAFCSLMIYLIFKQRIKILQRKQIKELERLQLEHDLKLSQETALRAQMNPHFIFNVLNSIKGYIYENDKKKAAGYLQRFSDLIRKILEQSSVSWIKLDEEIELLKLYIELEAMLFANDFEYTIDVDKEIETDHVSIPSLMLQPFIENAFKHGLRHQTGNKTLSIVFQKTGNVLSVTITDNGIGREASAKINSEKEKKYQSFSTEAINRISVINKNQLGVIAVEYVDLSIGTSVTIKIQQHD